MGDFFEAFLGFLTDLFAALQAFLGGKFKFGDVLNGLGDILGETTEAPSEAEQTA